MIFPLLALGVVLTTGLYVVLGAVHAPTQKDIGVLGDKSEVADHGLRQVSDPTLRKTV